MGWATSTFRGSMGRRLINIGHMLTGNFINVGVMMVSVALAARGLGPELWGSMVLVLALASTIERFVTFESWQALIKFIAEEEVAADPVRIARLYTYGVLLDIAGAALGAILLISSAAVLGPVFGIGGIPLNVAAIYALAMATKLIGAPSAALRLDGRFAAVAYSQILSNVLRTIFAAICLWQGAGLIWFMLAWTAAEIFYSVFYVWLGCQSLKRQAIPFPFTVSIKGLRRDFPSFLSFAWATNLSTALRTFTHEADELVVGAIAGQGAAGMYNLAKRISKLGLQIAGQVQTVLYPELARMWISGDRRTFRSTIFNTQLLLTAAGVVIAVLTWLFGAWLLRIGPGSEYVAAFPLVLTQVISVVFIMHWAPVRGALLAMGQPQFVLHVFAFSTILFYAIAIPGLLHFGPIGASFAHIILALVTAVLLDAGCLYHSAPRSDRLAAAAE